METHQKACGMVKYQFEIEDDDWDAWKNTVPRTKTLDERIRELIEADTEGRIHERREQAEQADTTHTAGEQRNDERTDVRASATTDGVLSRFEDYIEHRPPETEHGQAAITAAFELIRERGEIKVGDLKDELWAEFGENYSSKAGMWESLNRYLKELPAIESPYGAKSYEGDEVFFEEVDDE